MTSVNITETTNKVTINEGDATVVTVSTQGPQGPTFTTSGTTCDDSGKVDKSVLYYDSVAGVYKASNTWTVSTLVDGGNF